MGRVAIVCGSPSSEMLAPWDDPGCEIWVLGNRSQRYTRYDRIFEIHDDLSQHDPQYARWLVDKKVPLIVGENFPIKADHATVYPYTQIHNLIGSTYLTSSSAYMLGYAILNGYREVELYGVDMAVDDHEYFWQRPCMEYWVGFARGRGVFVTIPESSPLCKCDYVEGRDYGKEQPKTPFMANEYTEIEKRHEQAIEESAKRLKEIEHAEDEIRNLRLKITAHDAARQVYNRMAKTQRAIEAKQNISNLKDTISI